MKHLHLIGIFLASFVVGTLGASVVYGSFGIAPLFRLLVFAALIGLAVSLFCKFKGGKCKIRCEADYAESPAGVSEEE